MVKRAAYSILLCLFLAGCLSPVNPPPSENMKNMTLLVYAQDGKHTPLPQMPVELYRGTKTDAASLLFARVTDLRGQCAFALTVPKEGSAFTIFAGNAGGTRQMQTVFLTGNDTTIVMTFANRDLPCAATLNDTVRFVAACAKAANGMEFPDSLDIRYTSGCDEPVMVSFTPLPVSAKAIRLSVSVFDANGALVQGTSFPLPSHASFTVRTTYVPQAEGALLQSMKFTLTGGVTTSGVSLVIAGNAVRCDQCACTSQTLSYDLGQVVTDKDSFSVIQSDINPNKTICTRNDYIVHAFKTGGPFTLDVPLTEFVPPNKTQSLTIRFRPSTQDKVTDTLVIRSYFAETNAECYTTVVVRGEGVQPRCCPWVQGIPGLGVDSTVNPPQVTLYLRTDLTTPVWGGILIHNCASGGWLTLTRPQETVDGFEIDALRYEIASSSKEPVHASFTAGFFPTKQLVWPNGEGAGAAKTEFRTSFPIFGCSSTWLVNVIATVDTFPKTVFSNCIFRWDQNGNNGYDFVPVSTRGSSVYDANAANPAMSMISDLAFLSGPGAALSGSVRVRSGWKLVRSSVTTQEDFTYDKVIGWPEIATLKTAPFDPSQFTTFALNGVYALRVDVNGSIYYALIRVRELSDDGQKQKLCMDVLFPM